MAVAATLKASMMMLLLLIYIYHAQRRFRQYIVMINEEWGTLLKIVKLN